MRHLLAPLIAASITLPSAFAAEHAAVPALRAASAAASPAASAASAPAGNDTLEALHQRLSDRLGSVRQPTSDGSLLLRVPSRAIATAAPVRRTASKKTEPVEHIEPGAVHWSYAGETGPQAWARLKPEFATCASGHRQSPIDIRDGFAVQLEPVEFAYQASNFRVIDNGHTVQVNLAPGNTISVLGRRYELVQFHFHRPSEERINGRAFDMVVHLVHKDAEGRLAVVAVLLERGSQQPVVQAVWNNLPLEKGEEQAARVTLDPGRLLPEDRRYYTYMGSLTTPPCSEGVLWMVMKQPVQLGGDQIDLFARLYPMNARPVQPAGGRLIKESN
ncbi:carbonic anhydrase [Ideonella sp. BN130291]|uniref:carbonic anhydrase n=1 Tax=Ideonella sp. BN130291 TaxID=3112940 RepID=UPI002E2667A5|nr:carbonic anhydrase family protein [Ideonella sp. BN130291]